MAFQLLDLSDLITFQLKRLKLDELQFKDELHLQRHFLDLDAIHAQRQHQQQQHSLSTEDSLTANRVLQKSCPAELSLAAEAPLQGVKTSRSSALFKGERQLPATGASHRRSVLLSTSKTQSNVVAFNSSAHVDIPENDGLPDQPPPKDFRSLVLDWFQQLRLRTEDFKSDDESKRMREAGNDSYRKDHHSLKAADFYTEAIFLAPAQNSIAAAMAHANRSTVLHDCGMYQQSYDDCLCALDLGYPEEYHALIKLRQASCALKLRNFILCEQHLHELLHLDLSDALEARTHELWHECELRKTEKVEISVQTDSDLIAKHNSSSFNETILCEKSMPCEGRMTSRMKAATFIACNAVLFQEEAAAFVPSGQVRICDHCGITQFVPFPCVFCSNRSAIYCSRKCRAAHASIHAIECYGHQIELFEEFGREFYKPRLLQLAFRMLINGLPQMAPYCRKKTTVNKLWNNFNSNSDRNPAATASSTASASSLSTSYSALIQLDSTLLAREDLKERKHMASWAIVAQIMAIYLAECTDFFELIELTMPSAAKLKQHEWELLASTLLLRHIGQLRHKHLVHCLSFALPVDPHLLSPREEYKLWASVRRLHRGQLHLMAGDVVPVAYAVFPQTLSQCQHACTDLLYLKTNGTKLTAHATTDLSPNVLIKNCFISGDSRHLSNEARRRLLALRGLQCQDDRCCRDPEQTKQTFQKFHRYRCDNPNCNQVFIPSNSKRTSSVWCNVSLHAEVLHLAARCSEDGGQSLLLVCDSCEQPQKLDWLHTFFGVLKDCDCELLEERCKLYAALDRAECYLLEANSLKVGLARRLLEQCLLVHRENPRSLEDWELNKLGSVMRSALRIVSILHRVCSIQYVQHMSYLWDVMALGSYKCSDGELMQMLQALDFVPDEYKDIFINYYEDFIAPKYLENTYDRTTDTAFV